jgi:cytochrome c oxidase subunit 3
MPAQILEHKRPPRGPRASSPSVAASQGGGTSASDLFADTNRLGLLAFLGTVSMLFIGFTSAYILRRTSADWQPLSPPFTLWINTTLLLASSLTLETARKRLRAGEDSEVRRFIAWTGLLGTAFVIGQVVAWRQLAAQGVFLASNPHSSFFYLLTGVHGLHLVGGLVWFVVIASRARHPGFAFASGGDGLRLFATYWHFLGGLWIYLLFLLFVL